MQSRERERQRKHTHDRPLRVVLFKLRHCLRQLLLCYFKGKAGQKYSSVLAALPSSSERGSRSAIPTLPPRSIHICARTFFTTALRARGSHAFETRRSPARACGAQEGPLGMHMQRVLDAAGVRAPSARCTTMRLTSPKRCRAGWMLAVDSRATWWLSGSMSEDYGSLKMVE